jgi:hypothetical protein
MLKKFENHRIKRHNKLTPASLKSYKGTNLPKEPIKEPAPTIVHYESSNHLGKVKTSEISEVTCLTCKKSGAYKRDLNLARREETKVAILKSMRPPELGSTSEEHEENMAYFYDIDATSHFAADHPERMRIVRLARRAEVRLMGSLVRETRKV